MAEKWVLSCVLILLFNFCALLNAQIAPNSSITAGTNDSWRSPSGEFAFGFYSTKNNLYLVGIWFDKIAERTLVWSANRDTPAEVGSTIRLTDAGQLLLTYSSGSNQSLNDVAAASLGFMQDDGNFVLRDSVSNVRNWQSFDSPTNTILPGQSLVRTKKLYSNAKGNIDYSTGNFMLEMQSDGNLVLSAYHFADPGYWFTGTVDDDSFDNVSLVFNNSTAFMYLVNSTNDNIYALTQTIPGPAEHFYHRATIDDRGNFQQFVHRKSNGSGWTRVWRPINESCLVNAICGVYGMCSSPDNETMICNCLPGYIPLDPTDVSKGCHPETVVNYCEDPSMRNFTIEVIDDADFPLEDFADLARVNGVDVDGCKEVLMNDCYSMAAALKESRCIKKRMPLLNARKSASTKGIKALVKVPMKMSNPSISKGKKKNEFNIRAFLKISLVVSSVSTFLSGVAAIYYHPSARRLFRKKHSSNGNAIGVNFRQFTYLELDEATNGFSKTLGKGSSGKVYSGILASKDVQIEIAVKKLKKDIETSEKEFTTELKIIGKTHHKNLVRLLGFCVENNERILVYELMPNGTLANVLYGEGEKPSWALRAEMVLGIARGLRYLHQECETQIIHCDIKPQNVLLDANYIAKIADFGLSKLLKKDQTRTNTGLRGTMGYLAPEWLKNAPVTSKVDVHSFGVMLLEILCCRRHIELSRVEEESEEDDLVLADWVLNCMIAGELEVVVNHDPEVLSDFERFKRMALVGLWCIHPDPVIRPSMIRVTEMLEGNLELGMPPIVYD